MLKQAAKGAGEVKMQWFEQLADGLYHPSIEEQEESEGALSKVKREVLGKERAPCLAYFVQIKPDMPTQ